MAQQQSSGAKRSGLFWDNNPIIASVLPVVDGAAHVRVDEAAIAAVASWMAYEEHAPLGKFSITPLHYTRDEVIAFLMTFNVMDFAFTDFDTGRKFEVTFDGTVYVDADALVQIMHRAIAAGTPMTSGAWLESVTEDSLRTLFAAGSIEMPLLRERVEQLNAVGRVLVAKYDGSWVKWFDSCSLALYDDSGKGGNGLLERLQTEFPRFMDCSMWRGHRVWFNKLAQLTLSHINIDLMARKLPAIKDAYRLTAFADYIVPLALEVLGIFKYTPALSAAIMSGKEILRDSEEEVELRACTVYAVTRLTDEINALRPQGPLQLLPCQVDYRLWSRYHASHRPHHLTRTIMY